MFEDCFAHLGKEALYQSSGVAPFPIRVLIKQPDTAYEIKEDMKVLLNIINKLPEQQRKILLLRHFEDKSTDEIETETGLSNANIRVLLSRARKTIKELFIQRL